MGKIIISKNSGFTLAEILIVVAIITTLIMAGLFAFNNVARNARNARRRADLSQVKVALEFFHRENRAYPSTGMKWFGYCTTTGWGWVLNKTTSGPNGYIPNLAPAYIPVLPVDPLVPANSGLPDRCYGYKSDGVDYKLLLHMTPEGTWDSTDDFYDPCRPTWSWQISSSAKSRGPMSGACDWINIGW